MVLPFTRLLCSQSCLRRVRYVWKLFSAPCRSYWYYRTWFSKKCGTPRAQLGYEASTTYSKPRC